MNGDKQIISSRFLISIGCLIFFLGLIGLIYYIYKVLTFKNIILAAIVFFGGIFSLMIPSSIFFALAQILDNQAIINSKLSQIDNMPSKIS